MVTFQVMWDRKWVRDFASMQAAQLFFHGLVDIDVCELRMVHVDGQREEVLERYDAIEAVFARQVIR